MAYVLSDYVCNRSLPDYPVIDDKWYVPNIWNDGDIKARYDGWLNKPQYRIVQIEHSVVAPYFVFDETEGRDFVGNYSTLEEAHDAGCKACGVQGY
jgi:hypothetical protein